MPINIPGTDIVTGGVLPGPLGPINTGVSVVNTLAKLFGRSGGSTTKQARNILNEGKELIARQIGILKNAETGEPLIEELTNIKNELERRANLPGDGNLVEIIAYEPTIKAATDHVQNLIAPIPENFRTDFNITTGTRNSGGNLQRALTPSFSRTLQFLDILERNAPEVTRPVGPQTTRNAGSGNRSENLGFGFFAEGPKVSRPGERGTQGLVAGPDIFIPVEGVNLDRVRENVTASLNQLISDSQIDNPADNIIDDAINPIDSIDNEEPFPKGDPRNEDPTQAGTVPPDTTLPVDDTAPPQDQPQIDFLQQLLNSKASFDEISGNPDATEEEKSNAQSDLNLSIAGFLTGPLLAGGGVALDNAVNELRGRLNLEPRQNVDLSISPSQGFGGILSGASAPSIQNNGILSSFEPFQRTPNINNRVNTDIQREAVSSGLFPKQGAGLLSGFNNKRRLF